MRSNLSNRVYQVLVTLIFLASLKSAQYSYTLFDEANASLTTAVWATALWSVLSTSVLLLLIGLSLLCRSGASVWLTGWLFLSGAVPVLITTIGIADSGAVALLLLAVSIPIILVTIVLLYLIRTKEIRAP